MKKILFVVSEDWYFYSHRLPIALAAQKIGYEIVLAANLTDHKNILDSYDIKTIPLRFMKRSSMNIFREICLFVELWIILNVEKPHIIHNVSLKPVLYCSILNKINGHSFSVNALGGLGFIFINNSFIIKLVRYIILKVLNNILSSSNSLLIVQNDHDLKYLAKQARVNQNKLRLIRGVGVDLEQFSVGENVYGTPIVMMASRILREKGIFEFVEAAHILKLKEVDVRFVVVGKPDLGAKSFVSESQIQLWVQDGLIEWWGHFSDMTKILQQASIVCLPTYYGEGLPKVLIEAMACAKPIITTKIPGCSSLVRNGVNGLLVTPMDSQELANSIEFILINHSLRKSMGIESRKIAENEHDVCDIIKKTLSVYNEFPIKNN